MGEQLGPSEPLIVDQHRIDTFAGATGDHQWIHVDPAGAILTTRYVVQAADAAEPARVADTLVLLT
ncbi:hypothetical protein K7711_10765 [Nocardia sp. CA2R105]|nr:hypothetical protein [Nocardia coffeae]